MKTERIRAIPIDDPSREFIRTVYLSWDRSRPLSRAAQDVRNLIVSQYASTELV